MNIEDIRKALENRDPVIITESGEIVEAGEGQPFHRLPKDRWY